MEKVSPPVRILAIVLVLAGAAGMLALRTMSPSANVEGATAPVVAPKKKTVAVAPKPKAKVKARAKSPAPARAAQPAAKPAPINAPKVELPPTGFPKAVDAALRKHEVLVVSLVVPGARVDELAAAEAQAGAKLGGVGYLALNVLNEQVAHALLTKLDTVRDPSVLVLKRSGEVVLELNGFVDRETVAQAAANASS